MFVQLRKGEELKILSFAIKTNRFKTQNFHNSSPFLKLFNFSLAVLLFRDITVLKFREGLAKQLPITITNY